MNSLPTTFRVRFWGVTGSFANPLPAEAVERKIIDSIQELCRLDEFRQRAVEFATDSEALAQFLQQHVPFAQRSSFGGNTTCIEVQSPETLIIVDSGSGFRRLGDELATRWNHPDFRGTRAAHVLLTHAHMDHTFATPFFDPYYDARNSFQIWGPRKVLRSLHAVLSPSSSLRSIYFPPTYESMAGIERFTTIAANEEFRVGDVRVTTLPLNHPGDCLAYRLETADRSLVVATDHEHFEAPDLALAEFARDADLLYLDAQYLEEEYEGRASIADEAPMSRRGWGHSTIEAVVETIAVSGARRVLLGHHDPKRTDEGLAAVEQHARRLLVAALERRKRPSDACQLSVAREGTEECIL